jgi:hypothetical protein
MQDAEAAMKLIGGEEPRPRPIFVGAHGARNEAGRGGGALLDREIQVPLPVSIDQGPSGRDA